MSGRLRAWVYCQLPGRQFRDWRAGDRIMSVVRTAPLSVGQSVLLIFAVTVACSVAI